MPKTSTPLESMVSLPSTTPPTSSFAVSFPIVIGVPSTIQFGAVTPQVVMTENLYGILPLMSVYLPMDAKDSLLFSFEVASDVRGGLGDGLS